MPAFSPAQSASALDRTRAHIFPTRALLSAAPREIYRGNQYASSCSSPFRLSSAHFVRRAVTPTTSRMVIPSGARDRGRAQTLSRSLCTPLYRTFVLDALRNLLGAPRENCRHCISLEIDARPADAGNRRRPDNNRNVCQFGREIFAPIRSAAPQRGSRESRAAQECSSPEKQCLVKTAARR